MCSGRVDLEFMLRAFFNGQDGVFVGGCRLDECNYITHGNYDAWANVYLCKKIMGRIGINPERLKIAFMSGADGNLLAAATDEFTKQIKELGPLGEDEGTDFKTLRFKLEAAMKLVPYLRLVERERLRAPEKSKKAYTEFYESSEVDRLFEEIFAEKLAQSQIMLLLKRNPLSTIEISKRLGLNPSDVSKHMKSSSRHGLVKYDTNSNCYALA